MQRPDCMETVEDACASSSAFDLVGTLGYFMSACSRCVLTLELDFSRASNSILSPACPAIEGPPVGGLPQLSVVCPVAARLTTPALGLLVRRLCEDGCLNHPHRPKLSCQPLH
jgi:hypothetical protein